MNIPIKQIIIEENLIIIEEMKRSGSYDKKLPINSSRVKMITHDGLGVIKMNPKSPRKILADNLKNFRSNSDNHRRVANQTMVNPLIEKLNKLRGISREYNPGESTQIDSSQSSKDYHNKQANDYRTAAKLVYNNTDLMDPRKANLTKINNGPGKSPTYQKYFSQDNNTYTKEYDQYGNKLDNRISLTHIYMNPDFNNTRLKKSEIKNRYDNFRIDNNIAVAQRW